MRGALLIVALAGVSAGGCAHGVRTPQARIEGGHAHGWVRTQSVDLLGIRARLELATGCRYEPVTEEGSTVLSKREIEAASCRSRPYDGALSLWVVDEKGVGRELRDAVWVREGRLQLRFADLERLVGPGGLARVNHVELGRDAWAGRLKIAELRTLLASWHLHWVGRGRGAASLYVAAHPDGELVDEVRALEVEAQLARQEADYLSVSRGALSARSFLDMHLWSPYRLSVREMRDLSGAAESADNAPE